MDGDSSTEKNKKKTSDDVLNFSHVLQPIRVRRSVPSDNELDRVLLGYGFNFLLPFGAVLWVLFLVITNL